MPVMLFLLWIALNGRVTAEIAAFGILVTALVYLFMVRVFHWTLKRDMLLLRSLPIFLVYLLNLIREAAVAAARVALLALSPGKKPEPKIVEFNSGLLARAICVSGVTNRLIATNMIGTMVNAAILILSAMLKENWLIDVALIYTMISFVSVLILTRVIIPARDQTRPASGKEAPHE